MEENMNIQRIAIDKIKPNPWNPNEMDDETFNRLTAELDTEGGGVGYIDPIQVVPMEDGTYRVIGGEHRYKAMQVLGHDAIDCVVLAGEKWRDEDLQKFVTTRLNMLRGKMSQKKFMDMYMDLSSRYQEEALQSLMGITDQDAWKSLTDGVTKNLKGMGLPKEKVEKFKEAASELKTVDDLALILNKIFSESGDTLTSNYMVFTFGGKEHLMIQVDRKTFGIAKQRFEESFKRSQDVGAIMAKAFRDWDRYAHVE